MEIQITSNTALPSGSQSGQQQGNATTADKAAASPTIQNNPSTVVTVTQETAEQRNERRDDKLGKQPDESVTAQQAIESLRLTNRRTQLDFNTELNTVFLQVVDTRTDEVVETIPPEELVRQLKESIEPSTRFQPEDSGGAVIDQSV